MANADTLDGAGVNSGNALDAAKIQNNSEITKKWRTKVFSIEDPIQVPATFLWSLFQ